MPSAPATSGHDQQLDPVTREVRLDDFLGRLDKQIADLTDWTQRASESLLTFGSSHGFRRNTMAAGRRTGATSTARSLFALHEYRRFLVEENKPVPSSLDKQLRDCLRNWIFDIAEHGPSKVCEDSENGPNRFTFSHMLMDLTFSTHLGSELNLGQKLTDKQPELMRTRHRLARQLKVEIEKAGILGLKPRDKAAHHFVTLHAVRAIDVAGLEFDEAAAIRESVGATVLEQLGYHSAKVMARFDPGALVFATALLGRCKAADREQLTEHAVSVASEVQTADGAWLSEQIVSADGTSRIYVSSYEVGLGLSYLALREIAYGNVDLVRRILPCLEKVMELIRASYISGEARSDGRRGWANDRSRWPGLIESWATASVLSFMLRYRMVMQALRQQLVLTRYGVPQVRPKNEIAWPDLDTAFPPLASPAEETAALKKIDSELKKYTDPSNKRRLTAELQRSVLAPVLGEAGQRPDKASLILFGPPGSRKTSLAKQSAKALGWPILTLSPPNFLGEHGLDGFEGAAARIFNDLMRLRRVIVLFDECEDFFKPRRRPKGKQPTGTDTDDAASVDSNNKAKRDTDDNPNRDDRPEARTIGAFLTAGMLPRLQRLRDNRWVIFILATNITQLDELDEAVRRPGRFDFADELRHPGLEAQRRYLDEHRRKDALGKARRERFKKAIEAYCEKAAAEKKPTEVPYAVLDYIIAGILDDSWPSTRADITNRLEQRMADVDSPPSLTM